VVAAGAALGVSEGQGVSAVVIQIVGLVAGGGGPGLEGQYVESYTPDGNEGRGRLVLTPHVQAAKRYTGQGAVDALVRIATRDYDPLQHESPGSLAREALAAMGVDPATYRGQ
jgi:hypothetical protein